MRRRVLGKRRESLTVEARLQEHGAHLDVAPHDLAQLGGRELRAPRRPVRLVAVRALDELPASARRNACSRSQAAGPRPLEALEAIPPRLDSPLVFRAPQGGPDPPGQLPAPHVVAGDRGKRGVALPARIYDLRSTFASDALAAGVSVFALARFMGIRCR